MLTDEIMKPAFRPCTHNCSGSFSRPAVEQARRKARSGHRNPKNCVLLRFIVAARRGWIAVLVRFTAAENSIPLSTTLTWRSVQRGHQEACSYRANHTPGIIWPEPEILSQWSATLPTYTSETRATM